MLINYYLTGFMFFLLGSQGEPPVMRMFHVFIDISSLFPYWEQHIPTLGMKCSHVGNKTFPSMGLFASLNERLLGK